MQPLSTAEAKQSCAYHTYPPAYFDLVWIEPSPVEKRGEEPHRVHDSVLAPALHFVQVAKPAYYVVGPTKCKALGALRRQPYAHLKALLNTHNRYTIAPAEDVNDSAVLWSNLPMRFGSIPSNKDLYTTVLTGVVSNTTHCMTDVEQHGF